MLQPDLTNLTPKALLIAAIKNTTIQTTHIDITHRDHRHTDHTQAYTDHTQLN